jgi:hypothetical protein
MMALFWFSFGVFVLYRPGNRTARKLQRNRVEEATRIGEAVPIAKRDFPTRHNLAVAYGGSGQKEIALTLISELEKTTELPKPLTKEAHQQVLIELREQCDNTRS